MLHNLGVTRSSLKPDHLLHTPDAFIRSPLPGSTGVQSVIHSGPRAGSGRGSAFTWMTAEFAAGGVLGNPPAGSQRFIFVLEGQVALEVEDAKSLLLKDEYAYLPADTEHTLSSESEARAVVIDKPYQPLSNVERPKVILGDEHQLPAEPLGGDPDLLVRRMMPDGPTWDFAVNTMTYAPGAALSQVEVHVMEHGLLMLEGGGIYRLGDSWYPVTAGDYIWMAPYCPQWFGALGKTPAKYLIYKDWFRHPLGE